MSRDEDAEVGRLVMGWPEIHENTPFDRVTQYGGWMLDDVPYVFLGGGCLNHRQFRPTDEAGDDYRVLDRIRDAQRDGMPIIDWAAFLDALYEEMAGRLKCAGVRSYEVIAGYTVGAYSRAALAVLKAQQKEGGA